MQTKVEIAKPKPTKFYTLFYDKGGNLFARKEFDGDPAKYLPLPVRKNDNRCLIKDGCLLTANDIAIYELVEVRRTPGLEFDEAIYKQIDLRPMDMTGVTIVDRQYDWGPDILKVFNELNNIPTLEDAPGSAASEEKPEEKAEEPGPAAAA